MYKKLACVFIGIGLLIGANHNPYIPKTSPLGWITLLSENFESGIIPSGWTVIDGNNDEFKWIIGTTDDLGSYTPPNYGTAYAFYSDDDAGYKVINYNEELRTPVIGVYGVTQLKFKYSYGFRVEEVGEKYRIHFRKKAGGSWTAWTQLKVYTASVSGTDSFDLTNQLPADSVQFRFFYSDSTSQSHFGWACACDNVIVEAFAFVSHDAGVVQIISPIGRVLIGIPVNVIVKYGNFGNNSETFPAIVRIFDPSNTPVFSKDTSLTLNAGQQININFGQWTPTQEGSYFIYSKTLLSGDEFPQDDSLGQNFIVDYCGPWKPYNPPPTNADRMAHATVYDPVNDKIYMISGTPDGYASSIVPYIYRYDPVTTSWTTNLANMPEGRMRIHAGYWNGKIYVPGGMTNTWQISNTLFIYDIVSNSWTIGPTLPEARHSYGLAVWNGNIYVIGGIGPNSQGKTTVYRFNIANNQWTTATPIPKVFYEGGSCYLGDTIYLVGGYDDSTSSIWTKILRGIINNQNPDQITWRWITNLPYPIWDNAACALPSKIYIIGGHSSKVWEYDISTNIWKELPQYVVPIAGNNFICARPQKDGVGPRIYVVAGDAYGNWDPPNNYYYYLERGIISVPERNFTEKPKIFFIKPSIIQDEFGIYFNLDRKSNVDVSIYSVTGQKIARIYKGVKEKGSHVIKYNANKLNPGVYFIILELDKIYSTRVIKILNR